MGKDTIVVIPLYNERVNLPLFLAQLREHYRDDVVFVDDGSTDGGGEFLLQHRDKRMHVVSHGIRRGYGAALLSGFNFAKERRYGKIATIDADLQHNPSYLSRFFTALDEYEVVLGSRYVYLNTLCNVPRQRFVINCYISKIIKYIWGIDISDPFCGMRAYRRSFLNRMLLKESGYGIALEIIIEIISRNAAFTEIPIEAIYHQRRRDFLDGLSDPRRRLIYYLDVIERKRNEEKFSLCQSPS